MTTPAPGVGGSTANMISQELEVDEGDAAPGAAAAAPPAATGLGGNPQVSPRESGQVVSLRDGGNDDVEEPSWALAQTHQPLRPQVPSASMAVSMSMSILSSPCGGGVNPSAVNPSGLSAGVRRGAGGGATDGEVSTAEPGDTPGRASTLLDPTARAGAVAADRDGGWHRGSSRRFVWAPAAQDLLEVSDCEDVCGVGEREEIGASGERGEKEEEE